MFEIPDLDELKTKSVDWLMGKVVSAAQGGASRLFDMGLGLYLSALGFGAAESAADAQLKQVQSTLTAIKDQLDTIASELVHLEAQARLANAQVLERIHSQFLLDPRIAIEDAYDNLLNRIAHGDPHERAWADVMTQGWTQGPLGLQHQLHKVHVGVAGTGTGGAGHDDEGVLTSCTRLLVEALRQNPQDPGALHAAYLALECRFADLLSVQAKGLLLVVVALNWRDRRAAEHRSGVRPADPEALVSDFPGTASEFLAQDFGPRLLRQVDLFLQCVDRLVLTRFDPRTRLVSLYKEPHRDSASDFTMAQSALLDAKARDVYARADLLAAGICPDVHGHAVVVRLVGDPRQVERAVRSDAGSPSGLQVRACEDVPVVYADGSRIHWPLAEAVALEVVPVAGHRVGLYGPPDVLLPEAQFPSREYLEWWKEGDTACARAQTQVAVAKLGVRQLWVPEHPDPKAMTLPVCHGGAPARAFHVLRDASRVDSPARVERLSLPAMGADGGGERRFGHFVLPLREMPGVDRWAFSAYKPESRPELAQWELRNLETAIFQRLGPDWELDERPLLKVGLRDTPGRRLVATYTIASHAVYEDTAVQSLGLAKVVRNSPYIDHSFHFQFAVGTPAAVPAAKWLQAAWNDVRNDVQPMALATTPGWVPISVAGDHASGGSAASLRLVSKNDTPHAHGGLVQPHDKVLAHVYCWIDEIEIALARA